VFIERDGYLCALCRIMPVCSGAAGAFSKISFKQSVFGGLCCFAAKTFKRYRQRNYL
jgi:hypothetical protein